MLKSINVVTKLCKENLDGVNQIILAVNVKNEIAQRTKNGRRRRDNYFKL